MKYERKVIESHYHIMDWFNKEGNSFWEMVGKYRDGREVQNINILACPSVIGDVSMNMIIALYKLYHPEVYIHGGLIYDRYPAPAVMPEGMDMLTQYRELMEIGFDGIKMLETKPQEMKIIGRTVDERFYEEFFAAVEKDGTHMVWHANDPDFCWDINRIPEGCLKSGYYYGDGTYPSYESIYEQVLTVLERHPALNVTFAHFFFLSENPERLEKIFEKYSGVSVDLTPGFEMYVGFGARHEYYYDFFNRNAERIEYGTDASNCEDLEFRWKIADTVYDFLTTDADFNIMGHQIKGLKLPEETTEKILWSNFERRVGKTSKPINTVALKDYIEKYRHLIKDEKIRKLIDAEVAKL